ncbi:hypothetical protein EVAR_64188_1 [Eumeta japonica]|uniref:Uncharacterized protein n=1 Tax=Eumeta variegata TaxID=151549 RepID=A0A4C1ZK34_EUMVA|nr:hypothetical protein EVAR_64188_1 [Eumeta japonica]
MAQVPPTRAQRKSPSWQIVIKAIFTSESMRSKITLLFPDLAIELVTQLFLAAPNLPVTEKGRGSSPSVRNKHIVGEYASAVGSTRGKQSYEVRDAERVSGNHIKIVSFVSSEGRVRRLHSAADTLPFYESPDLIVLQDKTTVTGTSYYSKSVSGICGQNTTTYNRKLSHCRVRHKSSGVSRSFAMRPTPRQFGFYGRHKATLKPKIREAISGTGAAGGLAGGSLAGALEAARAHRDYT